MYGNIGHGYTPMYKAAQDNCADAIPILILEPLLLVSTVIIFDLCSDGCEQCVDFVG